MRFGLRIVFGACSLLGLLMPAGCATGPMHPSSSPPSLLEALRTGGHVIYMRHTTADVGRDVPGADGWWKKCGEGHRMLSDKGRAEVAQIGEAIRRLHISISEICSSEYCRAVEAARLLALGEPKTDARLNGWPAWKAVDPERGLQAPCTGDEGASRGEARSGECAARLAQAGLSRSDRPGARRPERRRICGVHPRWPGRVRAPRPDQGGGLGGAEVSSFCGEPNRVTHQRAGVPWWCISRIGSIPLLCHHHYHWFRSLVRHQESAAIRIKVALQSLLRPPPWSLSRVVLCNVRVNPCSVFV